MFENLNRYSEILILTCLMILPFCHFLDKEGYHFTWVWFSAKCSVISFLCILIELIEASFIIVKAFKRNNELDDQNNETIIKSELFWNLFYFKVFSKVYNILMIYMLNNLKSLIVNNHFSYTCLLYTSPSPRDLSTSRMPSSA